MINNKQNDENYFAFYMRRLYRHSLSRYHITQQYNTSLQDTYFTLYEKLGTSKGAYQNDQEFLKKFERMLDANKLDCAENSFLPSDDYNYHKALEDFNILQINTRQLDTIMECDKNIDLIKNRCEEELQKLDEVFAKDYPRTYYILKKTYSTLLSKCSPTLKDEQTIKYQDFVEDSFYFAHEDLRTLSLKSVLVNIGKGNEKYNKDFFDTQREIVLSMLDKFALIAKNTFLDPIRRQEILDKNSYFSFIYEDEVIELTLDGEDISVFYDLYMALFKAYKIDMYVKYLSNVSPVKLNKYLDQLKQDHLQNEYEEVSLYKSLLYLRKDFKHLGLIIFGLEMGLNLNSVKNIAKRIDSLENIAEEDSPPIYTKKTNPTRNNKNKHLDNNFHKIRQIIHDYAFVENKIINAVFAESLEVDSTKFTIDPIKLAAYLADENE